MRDDPILRVLERQGLEYEFRWRLILPTCGHTRERNLHTVCLATNHLSNTQKFEIASVLNLLRATYDQEVLVSSKVTIQ